jgi:hypothetical protein
MVGSECAQEKWLVECGVLQAIALRMPPGPPSGSGYGFAAMSRGWPAAFRGVEDEIVNLVGEGANQLIEAESHCSEQTSLSLAETSSVTTAPSETRKYRQPPDHSVATAPSEVGWSEGGGQRDGIVVAETTMAKPKRVEWALTVDKHGDNQGGVKGEAGDRRALAGEAGGHQRGEAGMKPQDASWDESQVRGLSMIEARVMSLDRLQNLAEQVALELEVARADLERAIKSGDYGVRASETSNPNPALVPYRLHWQPFGGCLGKLFFLLLFLLLLLLLSSLLLPCPPRLLGRMCFESGFNLLLTLSLSGDSRPREI